MFLSESLTVDQPLAESRRRIVEYLRVDHVEEVTSAVLVKAGVGGVGKQVIVESLAAYDRGEVTVVPVRWVASGAAGQLFPTLDGNLELVGDESSSTIALIATYRPPLRAVGTALDRLALHRVAAATVRGFLTRLAEAPAVSLR